MEELIKNKKKLLINAGILLIVFLAIIVLLIGSAPLFKGDVMVYVLMLLFLISIPLVISIVMIGLRVINGVLYTEKKVSVLGDTDLEKMDKEVEEKVKEASELSFNLSILKESLSGSNDWGAFGQALLTAIGKQIEMVVGVVYKYNGDEYNSVATYGYFRNKKPESFKEGEGITGQVVKDKKAMFLSNVPKGYVQVVSGLGKSKPSHLSFIPIISNDIVVGVVEFATFDDVGIGVKRLGNDIGEYVGELVPEI